MNYGINGMGYQNPFLSTPYGVGANQPKNDFYCARQELVRVNGLEGAKAYQMQANSVVALFDSNDDYFYLKQTDGAGFGSIRTFKFEELNNLCENVKNNANTEQFVTRKDMEEYVEQFISKATAEANSKSNTTSYRASKTDNAESK